MIKDRFSYAVMLERNDGAPDEELIFNCEEDARENYERLNDPDDADNASRYSFVSLVKIDWVSRRNHEIDSIGFGD